MARLALRLVLPVVLGAACVASGCAAPAAPVAAAATGAPWPGCAHFATQPGAQRWWEGHGRPGAADGDHDGVVCEDLSQRTTGATACRHTRSVVGVRLERGRYGRVLAHARRAHRRGWPSVYVINRRGADARRDLLLRHIPTRRGYDRDEAPPAVGRGRGPAGLRRGRHPVGWRADVAYVGSSENRSAGARLGHALAPYCDGTRFRYLGVR